MLQRRTGLRRSGLPRSNKPINPVGRVTRYRAGRKKQWISDHPPDANGYWPCVICHKPVHIDVMKLAHTLPKGSTPKAIAEADDNLGPAHKVCNGEEGSSRARAKEKP